MTEAEFSPSVFSGFVVPVPVRIPDFDSGLIPTESVPASYKYSLYMIGT